MDESVTPSDEPERWLPIIDWEGLYEVSDLGRVRSLPRMARTRGGGMRLTTPCMLKLRAPTKNEAYLAVQLRRPGERQVPRVHVLVARAFLGPRPEDYDVCHGPAGKLDNRLSNLSYGTRAKNLGPDRWRDGTSNAGVRNGNAKLTDEIVRECRVRASAGESSAALAREFGVSDAAMQNAVSGTSWRHVLASLDARCCRSPRWQFRLS